MDMPLSRLQSKKTRKTLAAQYQCILNLGQVHTVKQPGDEKHVYMCVRVQ